MQTICYICTQTVSKTAIGDFVGNKIENRITKIVSCKTNIPKDVEFDTEKSTKIPEKRYVSSEKRQ